MSNTAVLRTPQNLTILGVKLKYYPLSFTHLGTFLQVLATQDEKLQKQLSTANSLDSKMELLKTITVPLLEKPESMMQAVFNLVTEAELYELIAICFPALKDVDRNKIKPSLAVALFFLIWFTYIPEITKQTVELGEELSNEDLANEIAKLGNTSYTEGVDNLKILQALNP